MSTCIRIGLLPLILAATGVSAGQPTVSIEYSPRIDRVCSLFRGPGIKNEWQAELTERMHEFEQLWAAVGPSMIAAAEDITGHAFPAKEVTARLTLCNVPSQSIFGISVNMRYALRSFTSTPVPMRYKVNTLFHELLHKHLDARVPPDSKLLVQHASEPARVKNHLHLLALEKAVLLRLGEPRVLDDVIAIDSDLPGGYYNRAWEIIGASGDTYLAYVAEISQRDRPPIN